MSQDYFAILTAIGEAKHANAAVLGTKVNYATMAVGDGNGVVPVPDRLQTALVHEVRSAPINTSSIDPDNDSQIIVEQVIPETEGGWWIREACIRDDDGDVIAVASVPPTYKPQLAEGSGRNQIIRIVLLLSNASVVNLKIDPSIVLATREYADNLFNQASGVEARAYGDKSHYPTFTVDARGRVTLAAQIETVSVWDEVPEIYIGDIIFVKGLGEMWWVENEFLTGYRTKVCGLPAPTLDQIPRSFMVELRGGVIDVSQKKYWGLNSFIQENSLMVPEEDYVDGEFFFGDLGDNMVKLPNQDDMFWRIRGTDADTANARSLGSHQFDAIQKITGSINHGIQVGSIQSATGAFFGIPSTTPAAQQYPSGTPFPASFKFDSSLVVRSAAETRASNAAVSGSICL